MNALILNLDSVYLTDEQFYQFYQNNRELKFERTGKGELIIMSPVGGKSGNREADLIADFGIWNRDLVIRLVRLRFLSYRMGRIVSQMWLGFDGNAGNR